MKQRFLNQKLGKRASRKAALRRAKLLAERVSAPRGQLCGVPASSPAAFLHAGFAAALAKAPTNNLLIPRRENRRGV